jgi:EF-P beta-lysylation protein EpmB
MRMSTKPWPAGEWRRLLADAVTEVDELIELLALGGLVPSPAPDAARRFPLRVPRGFIARMRRGDVNDALLRQVLPVSAEDDTNPGYTTDPLGEIEAPPDAGVLHKYRGRALVVVTGACAVHCRYCFRRHFPYAELGAASRGWDAVVAAIAADPELSEVIFSGGDPLTLPDQPLAQLAHQVAAVPDIRRLRIHTRLPIVLPQRVDEGLVDWLARLDLPTTIVVHVNHAQEIDTDVRRALACLRATGATVLNQAVLLRGINDSVEVLAELGEVLFDAGVLPYYLHMLDPVQCAAHFAVTDEAARDLVAGLQTRLPGYLVPRLVREVLGAPSKFGVELWA